MVKAKKKVVAPKKKVAKKKVTKAPEEQQRLVAERNVERMKAEGWKVIGDGKDRHGKVLNVRTHSSDLTLMEK